jgi:hypothetical protein
MRRALGVLLAVAGVGLMLYSQLIRAEHSTIPPSAEEAQTRNRRRKVFGAGASLSLFGLLLLLVP